MTPLYRLSLLALALGCSSEVTSATPDAAPDVAPDDVAADLAQPDESAPDVLTPDALTADILSPDASPSDAPAACGACTMWSEPTNLPALRSTSLTELSGIAASRRTPGVFYVHNDSGDTARFFAVRAATGALEGEYHLTGARAVDWEDLGVGPCPTGSCVYVGDIGDNNLARAEYALYRIAEPELAAGVHEVTYERFPFVYPDGPHNAETLLVVPGSGAVYVVTKTEVGNSFVYRFPSALRAGERATLTRVAEFHAPGASPLFTGGSVHPCAPMILLRTYNRLYLYSVPSGMDFEAAFRTRPESMPVASESQGESVGFLADGRGYVTLSEGENPVIHAVGCM